MIFLYYESLYLKIDKIEKKRMDNSENIMWRVLLCDGSLLLLVRYELKRWWDVVGVKLWNVSGLCFCEC